MVVVHDMYVLSVVVSSRFHDTLIHITIIYISDNVGVCNRIDKCGYHYTPKQYFTDNPWKRDNATTNSGSLRPPKQYFTDNPWKRDAGWMDGQKT